MRPAPISSARESTAIAFTVADRPTDVSWKAERKPRSAECRWRIR